MAESRRKRYYIDKIFQNKFLFLFLGLTFLSATGNVLYLSLYLKKEVEHHLYMSHFVISNINEIIAQNIITFNVILLGSLLILVTLFYCLIRKRLKYFIDRLSKSLSSRKDSNNNKVTCNIRPELDLTEEFETIHDVFRDFFKAVDQRLASEQEVISCLNHFLVSPDAKAKKEVLAKLKALT